MRRRFAEDPRFATMREELLGFHKKAERQFLISEVNLEDQCHHIRRICDVIQNMAFLHLMTGQVEAGSLALESVRTLMKFPFWDFFIEGDRVIGVQGAPRCAVAVAAALDWLGELVPADERKAWLMNLAEKGCEPCWLGLHNIRHPRSTKGWSINPRSVMHAERMTFPNDNARRPEITQTTNLRAAPAGGLAIGAVMLGLQGKVPAADLDRWLEMAIHSLRVFETVYLPDGSYGEGVNYGNYTSESIFLALVAMKNNGVADLRSGINWRGHLQFMLNMAMPTAENPNEVVNIGDSGRHRGQVVFQHPDGRAESRSALAFWVAREFRDGSAQWFGEHLAAAHNIWSLIFFDETVVAQAPENRPQTWYPDLDWVVARTGFRSDDLVVSLRSGIGWNHEHADRNSIIIKCHGEQLIVDPCRPPYPFYDPCWMMRTTAGHSAILVDGAGHFYNNGVEGTNSTHAQARLVGKGEGAGYSYFVSDATQAYRIANLEIKAVVRAVLVFFELKAVVVVDRVAKYKEPAKIEARFFADNWDGAAEIATTSDGFEVHRPGAFACAKVFCRAAVELGTGLLPIPAERAAKHPFVAVTTEPTMATTLITAFTLGRRGESPGQISFISDPVWIDVTIGTNAGSATCRINDGATVPQLVVSG
ncbi:MAG: heparinase II/III-family protein [Cephaloticoccus sp.]|nr:heparinase II/III-family protein [Cephaloticoccus sp.]MCF7759574.1 heparinase II/III-family protein [Cephaloticoccus sp.]